MGWYARQVVPRVVGNVCAAPLFDPWRARTCEGLSGQVLELGMGSGANLPHLSQRVTRLVAVEPDLVARRRCVAKHPGDAARVDFLDELDGRIDLEDGSLDHALCTFTLCTVADPVAVLGEMLRVVRPGGSLRLLEHGVAPDERTARWQHRLDPLEQRLAGGCSLTRDPLDAVRSTNWSIQRIEQGFVRGPRPWSYFTSLTAKRLLE